MELKSIPLTEICPYENNPRRNEAAVAAVAKSIKQCGEALLKRALGYDYEEKIMEARKDGTQKVRVIKRHVPPDTKAAERIYFLIESGRW